MNQSLSIHNVTSIELTNEYLENGNSRTIIITSENGNQFEMCLFGKTDVLATLPKSADYRLSIKEKYKTA